MDYKTMEAMEIYTIAHTITQTVSMGDCIDVKGIFRQGAYYEGDYHPCFLSKRDAEAYNKNLELHEQGEVVALILIMT